MVGRLQEIFQSLQETLAPISKFFYVITHPIVIFNWLVDVSYWLAVLISIACLIYYIGTKSRKPLRIMNFTIITYVLIKAISVVI
jgi:hypothetical protein